MWTAAGLNLRKLTKGLLLGAFATGATGLLYSLENAQAYDIVAHPMDLKWSHEGMLDSMDMRSVRRGYEVYKQVCAACHSLKFVRYRHFANNFMSDEEAKKEAAEAQIPDIDDKGVDIMRPGLPNDFLPRPYKNNKAAAAANSGAAPPDLSLMAWAREGGENYIFHLLTGYGFDTPAGVEVEEGKAYNPYFPNGSVLAMPQQLFDEGIEYEDGTPATISQQAKDVATFLRWTAEMWHDKRKQWFWKIATITPLVFFVLVYMKRHNWSFLKSQKIIYRRLPGREWTPESAMPEPPKDEPPHKKVYGK